MYGLDEIKELNRKAATEATATSTQKLANVLEWGRRHDDACNTGAFSRADHIYGLGLTILEPRRFVV